MKRAAPAWRTPAIGVAVLAFPWLPFTSFSLLGSANLAAYYALVAISLVVLTGWVGQISLGHAGIVGVGAYVSGHVVNSFHVAFPVNLLWAAATGALVAAGLGFVAVRVRGLYLAVATLIFGWMAAEFLFRQSWFTSSSSVEVVALGTPGTFPYFDFTSRRTYFYAAWAVVGIALLVAANLRDSKTGRAWFAVRGSEVAAASMGISVLRAKLSAFAFSGALAAAAGNLLLIRDQVVSPDSFRVETSLFFLAIAVVGGLQSLGGAVAAALLFAGLDEVFFRFTAFTGWLEVVPPLLLGACLLVYRGGLAGLGRAAATLVAPRATPIWLKVTARASGASRLFTGVGERLRNVWPDRPADRPTANHGAHPGPPLPAPGDEFPRIDLAFALAPAEPEPKAPRSNGTAGAKGPGRLTPMRWDEYTPALTRANDRARSTPLLEVDDVTVRFGGLTAVDGVSLQVGRGEIVGLIGPNGAGKTTMFNAIAGFNSPAEGRIRALGQDMTGWSVEDRALAGIGRTFQAIQLLPDMTVEENLRGATHLHNRSGFISHALVGPATIAAERDARRRVADVAEVLGLEDVLGRRVSDLPFGVLRMVELARALVTGSPLLMLDEPASGLDTAESADLARLLRVVRSLGFTLLLIEHDVQLVMTVSDYVYVLDYGALLAEGRPEQVQRDERVVAAYLGDVAPAAKTAKTAKSGKSGTTRKTAKAVQTGSRPRRAKASA